MPRIAPLASPETLSEASSKSPSPVPIPRPMRRTPKIPGNLSTAADDLKNNLHYAMLSAKNYCLREETIGSNSSSGNSYGSYESNKSLGVVGLLPPVPRRRDSVNVGRFVHLPNIWYCQCLRFFKQKFSFLGITEAVQQLAAETIFPKTRCLKPRTRRTTHIPTPPMKIIRIALKLG